jgi:hypothetical protein
MIEEIKCYDKREKQRKNIRKKKRVTDDTPKIHF